MKRRAFKRKQRERKLRRLRNVGQLDNYWHQKQDTRERRARSKAVKRG